MKNNREDGFIFLYYSERLAFTDQKIHIEFLKERKFKRRKKLIEDVLN